MTSPGGIGSTSSGDERNERGAPSAGRLAERPLFEGRVVRLSLDTVRFPDGSVGELEMIRHPGAAAVLPVVGSPAEADPEVLLLRQYRYAAGGEIYEVPAGLPLGPDEDWEACARRELEEETGRRAVYLRPMTRIFTTPGFCDEVIRLYVAWDLERGRRDLDEDEFLEVEKVRFSEAVSMVREGRIVDAKSIATILYAACFVVGKPVSSAEDDVPGPSAILGGFVSGTVGAAEEDEVETDRGPTGVPTPKGR